MQSERPNILWICTDQQRFDTLGCTGNPYVKTPNLDKLASRGVLFERAYAQNPVCAPSRASFMTGRYPRTCRLRQNGQNIPSDEVLVTKLLADAGYTCGLSGKLHLSVCSRPACKDMERRIDDGYTVFHWSHHPDGFQKGNWMMNEYSLWLHEHGVRYKTEPLPDCKYVQMGMPTEYHQSTWCVNKAIDFIEIMGQRKNAPWLFSINLFDPHHAFDPPKECLERYLDKLDEIPLPNYKEGELEHKSVYHQRDHVGAYDTPGSFAFDNMSERDHKTIRAAYWAMIDHVDMQVGRLLDALEQSGQLDNTVVIFMSDHGELLGDHGMYLKGPYFYESCVHVPLILSYPKRFLSGARNPALVELVDLAPTLLDLAGLETPEAMQGRSMLELLTENRQTHRTQVYSEYYNSNINHTHPKAYTTMLFDGRYKLIKVHGDPAINRVEGELYDLQTDPTETVNLWDAPEYLEKKLELLSQLCDQMAFTCDPIPHRNAQW